MIVLRLILKSIDMKNFLRISLLALAACSMGKAQQSTTIFPKGEKSPNVHHVGSVWLTELSSPDSIFNYSVSQATLDPGARLDWHQHPGGQILLITDGIGYYCEKGKARLTVRKGDVIKCQPGVEHWHGATPESGVVYIATSPAQKGKTVWLHRVSDQEYSGK
jgi:quercetin dioxygenase-like cupin family protein